MFHCNPAPAFIGGAIGCCIASGGNPACANTLFSSSVLIWTPALISAASDCISFEAESCTPVAVLIGSFAGLGCAVDGMGAAPLAPGGVPAPGAVAPGPGTIF